MSWETATDALISALNEIDTIEQNPIEKVGIPPEFPNGPYPAAYVSESRARLDYGDQTIREAPITSRALNNVVVVLQVDGIKDTDIHGLRAHYQQVIQQVRDKIEAKEVDRSFANDGDVGFSASVIDIQPNFDPTRPVAWVWFVVEIRAFVC